MVACLYLPEIGIAVERSRIPDLWGEPAVLIDCANIIMSVSPECAVFGVSPGQKLSGARTLCPDLRVLPYDQPAYASAAEQVWDILALESSTVEPVSPELCFFLIDHTFAEPTQRIRDLTTRLASAMRISITASIASSKFVAEYAATKSVPRTGKGNPANEHDSWIVDVPPGREAALLASCPLARISRLDNATRDRLAKFGITKLGDLTRAQIPVHRLSRALREAGQMLTRLARGIDGDPVKALWPPPSIERDIDFETLGDGSGVGVTLTEPLHAALNGLAGEIAEAMIARSTYGRTLRLYVVFAEGNGGAESEEKLAGPTSNARTLARAAIRLLGRITTEQPIVSMSLRAGGLTGGNTVQLALLDLGSDNSELYPHERKRALEATISSIRKRWGPGAVLSGALLNHARKIRLWTYPLGTLLKEEIEVDSGADSAPMRYRRRTTRGRSKLCYTSRIVRIHDRWKEREWFWGASYEHAVFRVDSDPDGVVELHQIGRRWMLTANAD